MIEEVSFQSTGVTLRGRFYSPEHPPVRGGLVMLLTGDGPSGSKSATWQPLIGTLLDAGVHAFIFDFLSQGLSDGLRTNLTLETGCQNFRDALPLAIGKAQSLNMRFGILGSSFGASVVIHCASEIPRYDAIAFKSPGVFLAESYETEHGFPAGMEGWRASGVSPITGLSYEAYQVAIQHNLFADAAHLKGPVLVVHGTADTIVPIVQSRRLVHLLGERARLIELPNVRHDYKQDGAQVALQNAVRDFFVETLLR